jgi:hypothetical protein
MKIEIEDMPKLAVTYDEARTRKVAAEAEIAELELERIRGTLCLTEDVVKTWENVLYACKAKFLAMPSKIAPLVANESEISKIQQAIEEHIKEALSELANYQPEINPVNTSASAPKSSDGNEAPDSAPAPKRGGMGRPTKASRLTK